MIKEFWGVLFLSLLCFSCSDQVAGGTEAESTIALEIVSPTGTKASYARARFLPSNYLSNGEPSSEWIKADNEGKIEYKTLDTGTFKIEVRYLEESESYGVIKTTDVVPGKKVSIDSLSLKKLASIEGSITPGQGPSVIRIAGLERFIVPDSAGYFVVDSLPLGDFELVIESRSNRGNLKVEAETGEVLLDLELGDAKGFAVEDFESFSGVSQTGLILGDGWWYTLDKSEENIKPLWDETLIRSYSGRVGCVSGGCARTSDHLGFLIGLWDTDYNLSSLDTLYFAAKGNGSLNIALAYGDYGDDESGLKTTVPLEENWKGYAVAVSDMNPYGSAKEDTILVSRIHFSVSGGGQVFLDDISLGKIDSLFLEKAKVEWEKPEASVFPGEDWGEHDALLSQIIGYGAKTKGGSEGSICLVTTEEDLVLDEEDNYVVASGSLRECAMKEEPVWIQFEKDGIYRLLAPLRIRSYKTIDGRGRDVRIAGMGILADSVSNLVFENLRFTSPAITEEDSSSRRALSIHNNSKNVWVDHCTFEGYPLVLLDIKRRSDSVTISWSRFENSSHAILLGLSPETFFDSLEQLTAHHNYFTGLKGVGILNHGNSGHYYNNFFMSNGTVGIACTDRARCLLESNIFNITTPVYDLRVDGFGEIVSGTEGYINMIDNWLAEGGETMENAKKVPSPSYNYTVEQMNPALALRIQRESGPR